jgi:hypothetical protein
VNDAGDLANTRMEPARDSRVKRSSFYIALPFCALLSSMSSISASVTPLGFDPSAVNVASTLDSLSIDPAKWFPRS